MIPTREKSDLLALMADVPVSVERSSMSFALVTKRFGTVPGEAQIGQFSATVFASETHRMPTRSHSLDYSTDDKIIWNQNKSSDKFKNEIIIITKWKCTKNSLFLQLNNFIMVCQVNYSISFLEKQAKQLL